MRSTELNKQEYLSVLDIEVTIKWWPGFHWGLQMQLEMNDLVKRPLTDKMRDKMSLLFNRRGPSYYCVLKRSIFPHLALARNPLCSSSGPWLCAAHFWRYYHTWYLCDCSHPSHSMTTKNNSLDSDSHAHSLASYFLNVNCGWGHTCWCCSYQVTSLHQLTCTEHI